jgi:hypothetical protein
MTRSGRTIPHVKYVRYVDTSIILNLLDVQFMNDDRVTVLSEFEIAVKNRDTMILPLSSIIETGNQIAHVSDGVQRRRAAEKFSELLRKMARGEFPWTIDKLSLNEEDLIYYADNFVDYANSEIGFGDLLIIHEFTRYVDNLRDAGRSGICIQIWSLDNHLAGYQIQL